MEERGAARVAPHDAERLERGALVGRQRGQELDVVAHRRGEPIRLTRARIC